MIQINDFWDFLVFRCRKRCVKLYKLLHGKEENEDKCWEKEGKFYK